MSTLDHELSSELADLVLLGQFLLTNYQSSEGGTSVSDLLADVMKLCERFGVDFDLALENARERTWGAREIGNGKIYWTVTLSHEVEYSDCLGVYAETEGEAERLAKEHFDHRRAERKVHEVTVHEVVNEGLDSTK